MSQTTDLRPSPAWANASEHSRVTALDHRGAERAIDHVLIAERIYRYGWAYDERDRELLGDCFTEDAVWEGSVMGQQPVGPFEGREAILDFLTDFWDVQDDQRRHIFTNVIVQDLADTTATAHAYLMLTASENAHMTPVTAGPYRLELVRESDSWRLTRLVGGWDAPF
jgi:ketosteroid isomerase-like protein